jgi:hypothetical protein
MGHKHFPLRQIRQQTFKNQTVQLDGNEYVDCTFENVTFKFEGEAPFRFTNDHFEKGSKFSVTSDSPPVKATLELVTALMRVSQLNGTHK